MYDYGIIALFVLTKDFKCAKYYNNIIVVIVV